MKSFEIKLSKLSLEDIFLRYEVIIQPEKNN